MRIRATGPHVLRQEDKTTHLGTGPGPAPDTHAALVQLTTYTTAQGSPSWPIGSSQGTCCYSNKRAGSHSLRDTVRKEKRELDMGAATFCVGLEVVLPLALLLPHQTPGQVSTVAPRPG